MGRINDKAGSMITELVAIKWALIHALLDAQQSDRILINTDSLSALQSIQNPRPRDNQRLVNNIRKLILVLHEHKNLEMQFNWVPSHIGITGNEIADQVASQGWLKDNIDETTEPSVSATKRMVKRRFINQWKESVIHTIRNTSICRYLMISPDLKPGLIPLGDRMEEIIYHRIRTEDSEICKCGEPLTCEKCDDHFSFSHYLTSCPADFSVAYEFANLLDRSHFGLDFKARANHIIGCASLDPKLFIKHITANPPRAYCINKHNLFCDKIYFRKM